MVDSYLADRAGYKARPSSTRKAPSGAVSSKRLHGLGRYGVIFGKNVSECGYIVTLGKAELTGLPKGGGGATRLETSVNGVFVAAFDLAGVSANTPSHLHIACGQ